MEKRKKNLIIVIIALIVIIAAVVIGVIIALNAAQGQQASSDIPETEENGYTSVNQLSDKRVGIMRGSVYEALIAKNMPDAKVTLFDKAADMAKAVLEDDIDVFVCSDIQGQTIIEANAELRMLFGFPDKSEIAFAFPKNEKGAALRDEFNEYLAKIKADGTYEKIIDKWMSGSDKTVEISVSDGKKGSLKMATTGTTEPYTFMYNGRLVGLDVDLAAHFSREYGYDLDISVMDFGAIIPGLSSGNYDIAGANITVTDERAESVYFSDSYTENDVAFVVKK